MTKLLEQLRTKRDEGIKFLEDLAPEDREADLTAEERASFDYIVSELDDLDERIRPLEEGAQRRAKVETVRAATTVKVNKEPLTYERGNGRSYFLDLGRAAIQHDQHAAERLQRHADEMRVETTHRSEMRAARAENEMLGLSTSGSFEKRANPNRTPGQGGEFVPPLWLEDDWIAFLRAGRTTANLCRQLTLPEGTDSINLPKIATGTSTAIQGADNSGVSSTDVTTTSVQAFVRTIAGQQDIALQLLEQSPVSFDEVIFADLTADYNRNIDRQVLSGTGAGGVNGGQLKGFDAVSGVNAVTYTDGTPTLGKAYVPIAQSISQMAGLRFAAPTALVMHPRRWYWGVSQLDAQNRPLIVPSTVSNFNPLALQNGVPAEGPAGTILGIDVYLDANVTTVDGVGTNQDRVYALYTPDFLLWEGEMRARAMPEILSGTLQVRLQVYNYAAFMPDRYAQAISIVSGTGLVAPAGF